MPLSTTAVLSGLVVSVMTGLVVFLFPLDTRAQDARPADVATPEAIVRASYEALIRKPGESFDWDRFRTLHLPEARMIPNREQRGGQFSVLTVEAFIAWVDSVTTVGGPGDKGFAEEGVHNLIEEYGDVAHVFSTYQKRYWDEDRIIGRGINAIQLVRKDGRWWIVSVVWDEDYAAGAIPDEYLGR